MDNGREHLPTRHPGERPRLFISYRRRSDSHSALLLKDRLTRAFGEGRVFRDVDDIEGGEPFPERIRKAVESCDVFLLLVSPGWVESAASLRDPADFVRQEIAAALARGVPVIPLLLGGARMPGAGELPEEIRDLAFRHALELSDSRWDYDVARLVKLIRKLVPSSDPFFKRIVRAFRSFFGTAVGALVVIAAVLFAAASGLTYALRDVLFVRNFESCVRRHAPGSPAAEARVRAGAYDSTFVRADEYAAALKHRDDPGGVPLVLRLLDSEGEVGAIFFRFFKADEVKDSVFKVEKVLQPPCEDVQLYDNTSLRSGYKDTLKNWNVLAVHLGGRDYTVTPDDRGDYINVTMRPAPPDLDLPWKK